MNNHTCVKPGCGATYESKDEEAYYCPPCDAARKEIAKDVDARMAAIPKKEYMSNLQAYDAARGNNKYPFASQL